MEMLSLVSLVVGAAQNNVKVKGNGEM